MPGRGSSRDDSETVILTTTTRSGYTWHRRPVAVTLPIAIGTVGLVALGAGQLTLTRGAVERDLTNRTGAALSEAGLGGVVVSASGRDLTLRGAVGTADAARAVDLAAGMRGVRVATFQGGGPDVRGRGEAARGATPTGGPTASSESSPSAEPSPAPGSVTARIAGGRVVLSGVVDSQEARQSLVTAAARAVGQGDVIADLAVDAASGAAATGLDRVLAALGPGAEATAELADGRLTLTGTVGSADVQDAAAAAAAAFVGDRGTVDDRLTVAAPLAGRSPEAVQAQLAALPKITFESTLTRITGQGQTVVDRVATILRANPDVRVEVQGHTDSWGRARINRELSAGRAEQVRDALTRRGIAADRLVAKGYGETRLLVPDTSRANSAVNRRVVFSVIR
jgi:outer membrane protein OmpA-like peptidoglycan-associated protein